MSDAVFDRAQAEYDAMEPPEYCPHDGDLVLYYSADDTVRYLECEDCGEQLPDPDEEEWGPDSAAETLDRGPR